MELGKLSESVLKRSVLKYVHQGNKSQDSACNPLKEAEIRADCALFAVSEGKISTATAVAIGRQRMVIVEAMINACNNLICGGAKAFGVEIALILPEALYESELRHMMEEVKEYALTHQITILGGHTTVSKSVTETIASVTVMGYVEKYVPQTLKTGMDIVMSKWIGLQGTVKLAKEQKEALLKRLPPRFIAQAVDFENYMSVVPEAEIAIQEDVCAMHDVSGGGIFRALWELADIAGTGLRVELKKIPVKQETIEVCEVFGLNPYELLSGGALLMVTPNGEALVEKLKNAGIYGAVIGTLTDNHDRVIVTHGESGEELRYLDRPRNDEIDRV